MAGLHSATATEPRTTRQARTRKWLVIAGLVLAVHGAIHLLGFVEDWQLARIQAMPYHTTVLAGRFDLGTIGIRFVGLWWLLAALGFLAVGAGLLWYRRPWLLSIAAVTALSLIVCVLGWPDSAFGVFIDFAIFAALAPGVIRWTRRVG